MGSNYRIGGAAPAEYAQIPIHQARRRPANFLTIHPTEQESTRQSLILFVHGLGGSAYMTWKHVLTAKFVAAFPDSDFGVVSYPSGIRRLVHPNADDPEGVGRRLAHEIKSLPYQNVVIVGHSMGGLVAREAIRKLFEIEGTDRTGTRKVAGIVTICTPQLGSIYARFVRVFAPEDYRTLKAGSRIQQDADEFFSTHVNVQLDYRPAQLQVPVFAASAQEDALVTGIGAELSCPAMQRGLLNGAHRTTLKRISTHDWLRDSIATCLKIDSLRTRRHVRGTAGLKTTFAGRADRPTWEYEYRNAMRQFADESGIDVREEFSSTGPDLHVRLLQDLDVHSPTAQAMLVSDVRLQETASRPMGLGVCPVGTDHANACKHLVSLFDAPRLRWITGAAADDGIADVITLFLRLTSEALGLARPERIKLADEESL